MTININSYAFGNAAENKDCQKGPTTLQIALTKADIAQKLQWQPILQTPHTTQKTAALPDVVQLCQKLAEYTQESVLKNRFFMTLGGDHSGAIGSWSGVAAAHVKEDIGLIWIDAHMDAHTPKTSLSQNIHGMPLAVLLGQGDHALTHLMTDQPKLKPQNIALIGIRCYEPAEATLLKQLGARIYFMEEIEQRGLQWVIQEAVQHVTQHTVCFGVSIDVDAIDPKDAPGTGTLAENGIRANEFLRYFPLIAQHSKLIGADIMEFNPVLDVDRKTEKLIVQLIQELVSKAI